MKTIGIVLGKQHYNQAWNKFVNQQNPHCNRLTSYLQIRTQKERVVHFFLEDPSKERPTVTGLPSLEIQKTHRLPLRETQKTHRAVRTIACETKIK